MTDKKEIEESLESFRNFCNKEIAPNAAIWDEEGEIPREIFTKLANVGYFGVVAPEEWGGSNLGIYAGVRYMETLSEFCGSTFFSTSASFGLFGEPIKHFGTLDQKSHFYGKVLTGEKIGCLAVTEPQSGSDVSGIRTVARMDASGRIFLKGQKTYITNSSIADYAIVLARFWDENDKDSGLTHFLVELDNPGIQRGKPMKKLGLRASVTGELFFDNAEIGGMDSVLGGVGKGFRQTMMTFNEERLSIAAYCLGVVRACLKESLEFSRTRKSFGKSIYEHQSVSHMLAELYTIQESIAGFTYRIAEEMDNASSSQKDKLLPAKCASLKYFASTQARNATNIAVQIHGGAGFMEEYKVARLYRDIRLAEIGGGTSEIQKSIIGSYIIKDKGKSCA